MHWGMLRQKKYFWWCTLKITNLLSWIHPSSKTISVSRAVFDVQRTVKDKIYILALLILSEFQHLVNLTQVSLKCESMVYRSTRLSLIIGFCSHLLLLNSTCLTNATLACPQHHMTNGLWPIYHHLDLRKRVFSS